ncbi:MAG: Fpg/Nei family DNA glycosylase [Acidimicrobiia bacterium]
MPEGHTVHRLARDQQGMVGEELRATSPQGRFADGAAALDGRRLIGVEAAGKHLFHAFEGGAHLHVHLGMQGKFLPAGPDRPPLRQARVRLESPRQDVAWELVAPSTCELVDGDRRAAVLARLGPDPLRPDADGAEARRRLGADGRSIGAALLDQAVVAGVGNVFRAEVLFACGVHPRRPAAGLAPAELDCLWTTLRTMMAQAVEDGTIQAGGRAVYKQDRCARCGTPVEVEEIGGRTSYACPLDQPSSGVERTSHVRPAPGNEEEP